MATRTIETAELSRDFGDKRALDRVELGIGGDRIVALLGPNGAGKSTLLKLLAGLIEPSEGEARLLGACSRSMPPALCGRVAVMIDGHEPPDWATPRRLIDLQAEASPAFDRAFAEQTIFSRGVEAKTPYGSLSKGQKRWALAGLCLASGADALLLDEPTDGLDPAARRELHDHLRRYATERAATILVATHLLHDIERIADEVAVIHQGRLLLHASLEDLREQVREIELPADAEPPAGEGVTVLNTRDAGDSRLAWVRCEPDAEALAERLAPEAVVRPVNLEEFYLALTDGERCPSERAESEAFE